MLVMIIIGWLVTVACFLLYVRRLRNIIVQKDKDSDYSLDCLFEPSPIANSEQPVEPSLPKIPRGWKKADGKTRHVTKGTVDLMLKNGEKLLGRKAKLIVHAWADWDTPYDIIAYRVCKPKKVFSSKPKTGKQRKTVTVKKRVTK